MRYRVKGKLMEFLITNIESEKSPNGKTTIYAMADDTKKTQVVISCANNDLVSFSKKSIKILLNKEYNRVIQFNQKYFPKIGDII